MPCGNCHLICRFNAAEATTIISYEDGSDGEEDGRVSEVREGDEEEDRDSEGQEGDEDSGSAASPSPAKGPRPHARGAVVGGQAAAASRRATEAAATAAFEAALFGRAVAGHGGKAKGAAVGLPAWSAEQEASPARMGAATVGGTPSPRWRLHASYCHRMGLAACSTAGFLSRAKGRLAGNGEHRRCVRPA